MRAILLLAALSAIMDCAAMPLNNGTTSLSTPPDDIEINKKKPKKKPKLPPFDIPISTKECRGHNLTALRQDWENAKEELVQYTTGPDNVIYSRTYLAMSSPNNTMGVTWYICNCKLYHGDRVPQWEVDAAQKVLADTCGAWMSGEVYSRKWKKGYNVVPTEWFLAHHVEICPFKCFAG
ncbi:hypothetical protein F4678DRAFT_262088 [Xylaria arbuscula]|nr:hypothetical protein F4678DRAFT_262088 [Xylaria arbuscula]